MYPPVDPRPSGAGAGSSSSSSTTPSSSSQQNNNLNQFPSSASTYSAYGGSAYGGGGIGGRSTASGIPGAGAGLWGSSSLGYGGRGGQGGGQGAFQNANPYFSSSPSTSASSYYGGLSGLPYPSASTSSSSSSSSSASNTVSYIIKYIRRGLSPQQIDVEYIAYQFIYALFSPSKISKLTTLRKQTKNTWARGDASFSFLLAALVAPAALAWGIAYGVRSPLSLLWLIVQAEARAFLFTSSVAALTWYLSNTQLRANSGNSNSHHHHSIIVQQKVEPGFAWDTACNAFVPLFICLHVIQYLLLPVLLSSDTSGLASSSSFVSILLANSLYAVTGVLYWYSIFAGYLVLPFITRANVFLLPAGICLLIAALCTVFGINLASVFIGTYVA